MKSLLTFVGILAFNFSPLAAASEFACPVSAQSSAYTCSGTVKVQNMDQLIAYKNTLGTTASKPTVAKGLLIEFSPTLTADLSIATPCKIKTAPNITINTTGNVCLNGTRKVQLDEGFHFSGKNLYIESSEDIAVDENSVIVADDIRLLSKGSSEINQAFFREGAQITAANILIESADKGFVGKNSNLQLTGTLAIHALGDDEASIRQGTVVNANKIDVNSTGITKIANLTVLTANEITLIGAQGCEINKGSVMNSPERIGNCFLTSLTKETFSVDKNRGNKPLTVTFNASTIADAKGYKWDFGDGQTLSTLTPTTTHTYTTVGSFTAALTYATKDNYKGLKSAGSVRIDTKEPPVIPTNPPKGYFTYAQDGTFVYLKGFVKKTQFDIASAYYVIDDNQDNKIYMTNFYANSQSNVEMNTFGAHKITMYVEDVQGQKYNTSMNITLVENENNIAPIIRFTGEQSAIRTVYIDMSKSFIPYPDESLKYFKVDFGDGTIVDVQNAVSVGHTYAQAGTYNVKVSAKFNDVSRALTQAVTVTDSDKPILAPRAGFYYHIFDFAGNVVMTDDTSQSPNGNIISYEWDFGDGIIAYGKQASYFFAPGDHLVTLTVTDVAGVRASQTQIITTEVVGTNLVAAFDCWDGNINEIECDIFALDKLNQISRVRMEWGDGKVNTYPAADVSSWGLYRKKHTYAIYQRYDVKLTVNTTDGRSRVITKSVLENLADLKANITCSPYFHKVSCSALASISNTEAITNYKFDFGDGHSIENQTGVIDYFYSATGNYEVTLTITNTSGLTSQVKTLANVSLITPVVNLNCDTSSLLIVCNGLGSYDWAGDELKYEFDMGDGTIIPSESGIVSHSYEYPGVYEIKLKVTNSVQLSSAWLLRSYQVLFYYGNLAPIVSGGCNNSRPKSLDCSFHLSTDHDGYIVSYTYDFGDEVIQSANHSIAYTFASSGTKNISVKVTDNNGKSTSQNFTYVLKENTPPTVAMYCSVTRLFTYNCWGEARESDNSDMIASYKWDMGDGVISESYLSGMTHVYAPGSYTIKLIVKDLYGGVTTVEKAIIVLENQAPLVSINCSPYTIPATDIFSCVSDSSDRDGFITKVYYEINGFIVNQNSFIRYFNGGLTNIKLIAEDDHGLKTEVHTTVSVDDRPRLNFNCTETSPYHASCTIQPFLGDDDISMYGFIVENNEIRHGRTLEIDFDLSGNKVIEATGFTNSGLQVRASIGLQISKRYFAPKPEFISYVDVNSTVDFDSTDSFLQDRNVTSFVWNFGDGTQLTTADLKVRHSFPSLGTYNVSLTAIDSIGESTTTNKVINVYEQEVPNPGPQNDSTLEGVDSDSNNIRDDVQRWIAFEAQSNSVVSELVNKLAKTYQIQFTNIENSELIINQELLKTQIKTCLLGRVDDDSVSEFYIGMVEHFYMNTSSRSAAFVKVRESAQSANRVIPERKDERLLKCLGI